MQEIFKDIEGYEGLYQISNLGRVKSLPKTKPWVTERILKERISNKGYYKFALSKNNVKKEFSPHRLLAIAFIPNPENKKEVNHIDGNPLNNRIDNLEWATASENIKHAFKIGLKDQKGEKHPQNKLTEFDVKYIRFLWGKVSRFIISEMYNLNPLSIYSIINNKTWKHI